MKWINDGLIEFVPKVIYRYNPRKSKGNRQIEKITTLNMPLIVSLTESYSLSTLGLNSILPFKTTMIILIPHMIHFRVLYTP